MPVTDTLLDNSEQYSALAVTDDGFRQSVESETDLDADMRQHTERIHAETAIPNKASVHGFVYEVATGKLREVNQR